MRACELMVEGEKLWSQEGVEGEKPIHASAASISWRTKAEVNLFLII